MTELHADKLKADTVITPLEGYVWCTVRGAIHSDIPPAHRPNYDGEEFWDLYQDGTLCKHGDHLPVVALGEA